MPRVVGRNTTQVSSTITGSTYGATSTSPERTVGASATPTSAPASSRWKAPDGVDLTFDFVGNVEGMDFFTDRADVIRNVLLTSYSTLTGAPQVLAPNWNAIHPLLIRMFGG